MRVFGLSLAVLALGSMAAFAAPGDQWILGIRQINEYSPAWEVPGAGYSGPHSSGEPSFFGNAYQHSGSAGDIARVIWELKGNAVTSGRPVPTSTELYTIEYYQTPQPNGRDDYQPIESQFHGIVGETYPYEASIPWAGAFGNNHQYIELADSIAAGQWNATGPGPHTPASESNTASPFGIYMWLTSGSWLYAKWDFPFTVHRSWSALRLTQITGVAPPELDGDYNQDGSVDAADYVVWRKTGIDGDFGYDTWRANFGMTGGAGSATNLSGGSLVPEPASAALFVMSVAGMMRIRRREYACEVRSLPCR